MVWIVLGVCVVIGVPGFFLFLFVYLKKKGIGLVARAFVLLPCVFFVTVFVMMAKMAYDNDGMNGLKENLIEDGQNFIESFQPVLRVIIQ